MEKKNSSVHPQTFRLVLNKKDEKTPSRGEINKIYTENARKQAAELKKQEEKEKTK